MRYQQHIIIDGYNFIFRIHPDQSQDDEYLWRAREELISSIISYRGNKQIQITIVFDGQDIKNIGHIHRPHGIQVVFSRAPQKADPLIIAMVKKAKHKQDVTVITSDNELADAVKSMGCQVLSSELFSKKQNKFKMDQVDKKYNVNMSPQELDEWIDLFNNDGP